MFSEVKFMNFIWHLGLKWKQKSNKWFKLMSLVQKLLKCCLICLAGSEKRAKTKLPEIKKTRCKIVWGEEKKSKSKDCNYTHLITNCVVSGCNRGLSQSIRRGVISGHKVPLCQCWKSDSKTMDFNGRASKRWKNQAFLMHILCFTVSFDMFLLKTTIFR